MSPSTPPALSKIHELGKLVTLSNSWKENGQTIVFTNGCFDILHAGHIQYLEAAAQKGDRLIVAVNDDESVKKLKGDSRPINILNSRLYLLASLQCVDAVCSFSEDTPINVIEALSPDVLVKGGDYKADEIAGAKEVVSWGGRVEIIPYEEGYSTTKLENRILDIYRSKKDKNV